MFLMLLVSVFPSGIQAGSVLTLDHAWIRLLPAGAPAAGYFELSNHGDTPASLISASSQAFRKVQMHRSEIQGGVAHMLKVSSVKIGPGESVQFAPEGLHLMLIQATDLLHTGQLVPITLNFADGRSLTHDFTTRGIGN